MALASPEHPPLEPEGVDFFNDDEVDPELLRLEKRPSVMHLLLAAVVMAFAGFVAWTFRLDAAYTFADKSPIELGAVEEMAIQLGSDPDYLLQFGSNVYAHLSGIPQRRSVTPNQVYHQLVGAAIFIEETRPDDPLLRDIRIQRPALETRRPRQYVDANGRFLRFADLGNRQQGLIDFYQNGYNIRFCSREMSGTQLQFVRHLREELRPELEQQLGRLPTEEELDQAADEQFPCQHGYLFQVGRAPGDHLWTLFLFGFILLVELAGLAFIIRLLKRMWIALRL